MHASDFKQAGETDERLFAVAAGGRRFTLKVSFLSWMQTSRFDSAFGSLLVVSAGKLMF
jgi:hypothetical protein